MKTKSPSKKPTKTTKAKAKKVKKERKIKLTAKSLIQVPDKEAKAVFKILNEAHSYGLYLTSYEEKLLLRMRNMAAVAVGEPEIDEEGEEIDNSSGGSYDPMDDYSEADCPPYNDYFSWGY